MGRRLVLLGGAALGAMGACAPKPVSEPPPQTVRQVQVPTAADAGPAPVPLTGRGVAVPSDVKLEPPPKRETTREPPLASPTAN
jgi:hypothetical protein